MRTFETLQAELFNQLQDQLFFARHSQTGFEQLQEFGKRAAFPSEEALTNLSRFEESLPGSTDAIDDVLQLLATHGSAASTSYMSGRYFGFVNGGMLPVSLAAKAMSIFWDQNTAMEVISPISAKLESVVQGWLVELFGLPHITVAGFVSGTSVSNFCALAAARWRILANQGWNVNARGMHGAPAIRVVTSTQAHSTIVKAISLNGLGTEQVEWIEVDNQGRIRADLLPELDASTIVILQAGNVNSGAFDDFQTIGEKAQETGAWVHIDGAFGLWAQATSSLKHLTRGIQLATSWATDGHKTLNTPYDSGLVMCADPQALAAALHMSGDYIIEGTRDGMYYTPEMSRRSRVIELWAALRYLGRDGIDLLVHGLHLLANQFASQIEAVEGFTVVNEVVFNQVLVQCPKDEITERVIRSIQADRTCWVGGSKWMGRKVIRVSICSWTTTTEDIARSVDAFSRAITAGQ